MKLFWALMCLLLIGCASEPVKIAAKNEAFNPSRIIIVAPQQEIYVHQYNTSSTNPLAMASLHLPGLFVFGVIAATTQSTIKPSERVYGESTADLKSVEEVSRLSKVISDNLINEFNLDDSVKTSVVTSWDKVYQEVNANDKTLIVELSFLLTEDYQSPILFADLSYQTGLETKKQVFYKNQMELTGNHILSDVSVKRMNKAYKAALYQEYLALASEFAQVLRLDFLDTENPDEYSNLSGKRFVSPIPNSILIAEINNKQVIRYLGFDRKGAICSLPANSTRADGFCRRKVMVDN